MDCGFCLLDARAGMWCGGRDGFERKRGCGGGGGMVVRLRNGGGKGVGNCLVEWCWRDRGRVCGDGISVTAGRVWIVGRTMCGMNRWFGRIWGL